MSDIWAQEVNWESIEARFVPPAELNQPTPRRVVPRDGQNVGCRDGLERGCLGGCLVPLFLLGLLLLLWAGLSALLFPLGTTTTGQVTQRERGDGRASTYSLNFRFQAGSRRYQGQGQVRTEKWRRTRVGDSVSVRYFSFAPGLRPLLADDFSPWASVFGLGALGVLMVGISGIPLTGLFTRRRGKKLVRYGVATPAFILAHEDESTQLTLLIRDHRGRTFEIKRRTKGTAIVGHVETALYLPNNPQSAHLYNDLDWKAQLP